MFINWRFHFVCSHIPEYCQWNSLIQCAKMQNSFQWGNLENCFQFQNTEMNIQEYCFNHDYPDKMNSKILNTEVCKSYVLQGYLRNIFR